MAEVAVDRVVLYDAVTVGQAGTTVPRIRTECNDVVLYDAIAVVQAPATVVRSVARNGIVAYGSRAAREPATLVASVVGNGVARNDAVAV